MLTYRPLDAAKSEFRVIKIHKLDHGGPVECSLCYFPLGPAAYGYPYQKFLELDGSGKSSDELAILWTIVTNYESNIAVLNTRYPLGSTIGRALSGFSNDPVYREPAFENAGRYGWGDFVALSYEWGDPNQTAEIIVNGERVTVTKNLEDALRSFSSQWVSEEEYGPFYLWVDAVCINQRDVVERNEQVKRMKTIYTDASNVAIWVGPALSEGHEQAADLMQSITANSFTSMKTYQEDSLRQMTSEYKQGWKGVIDLAARSYWTRLWIIQEVGLGNTEARICYGDQTVSYAHYARAIAIVTSNMQEFEQRLDLDWLHSADSPWSRGLIRAERFIHMTKSRIESRPYIELMALLDRGREAHQMDARDKVYGLLGMMDPKIQELVVPDYTKPVADVYRDFTLSVIKATKRLEIIYQGAATREPDHLAPSWIPDWAAPRRERFRFDYLSISRHEHCRAAGDTVHSFADGDDASQLICRGFQFDLIDGLGCSGAANTRHDEHDFLRPSNGRGVRDTLPYGQGHDEIRRVIWDTLSLGDIKNWPPSVATFFYNFPFLNGTGIDVQFIHVISRFQTCSTEVDVAGRPFSSWFPPMPENLVGDLSPEFFRALGTLVSPLSFRRLITTDTGYLGMAPISSRRGDAVFILQGCNVPVVLRPNEDGTYNVIGDCYIHGIMQGEAMVRLETGGASLTDVILR